MQSCPPNSHLRRLCFCPCFVFFLPYVCFGFNLFDCILTISSRANPCLLSSQIPYPNAPLMPEGGPCLRENAEMLLFHCIFIHYFGFCCHKVNLLCSVMVLCRSLIVCGLCVHWLICDCSLISPVWFLMAFTTTRLRPCLFAHTDYCR